MLYKLIDKGREEIIIVFSGFLGRNIDFDNLDELEYNKIHSKFQWFKNINEINKDKLFIADSYNKWYGYYLYNEGITVIPEIQNLIKSTNKKKKIYFGTSKGGTGAIYNFFEDNSKAICITCVPQIKVTSLQGENKKKVNSKIFLDNEMLKKISEVKNYIKNSFGKIVLLTGINDFEYEEHVKFQKYHENVTLLIDLESRNHIDIILNNIDILIEILQYGKTDKVKYIKKQTYIIERI